MVAVTPSQSRSTTRGCCARSRTRSATGSSPSSTRAGSLRAADLARELGIPANQASFHLRQLAKYGLVEEAPEAARDKRDRVWRVVDEGGFSVEMRDMEKQPGGKAASRVFRQNRRTWGRLVVDSVFDEAGEGHSQHRQRERGAAEQRRGGPAGRRARRRDRPLDGTDPWR